MRRTCSFYDMKHSLSVQCVSQGAMTAVTAENGGILGNPPYRHLAGLHRTSKWLCFLTTCMAFTLGVAVGIVLPLFYVSPAVVNEINNNTAVHRLPLNLTSTKTNTSNISVPIPVRMKTQLTENEEHLTDLNSTIEEEAVMVDVVSFIQPQTSWVTPVNEDERTTVSAESVKGVFWSNAVEHILPTGFDERNAKEWRDFSHRSSIQRVEEGCGRMQNRLITFENGRKSCCRYRQNYDQIQGEIFSFYLSRLLGLRNLPPSSLGLVRPLERQWIDVQSSLNKAQWTEDRPVVYTQYLNDLEPAYIPVHFRGSNRHLNPLDVQHHKLQEDVDRKELITLAQWSDLLIFDYLTANLDRMVNNLYNMQWNPAMMDSPAHNLARDSRTGLLVFLDNESGLLHGYRLLDKYEIYHKSLLDSLCIFRKSTIESLRHLQSKQNVGNLLRDMLETRDQSLLDFLPFLPEKSIKTLNYRIEQVLEQVAKCQSLYGS